jgi:hypothetical protein
MRAFKRFAVLAIAAAAVGTVWLLPTGAQAAGTWSAATKLSGDTRWTWFPDVAADDSGNVHITWSGQYATPGALDIGALFYVTGNGQSWTQPNDIAVVWSGDAVRNALAMDSSGRLQMVYKGFGSLEIPSNFNPPDSIGPEDLWYTSTIGTDGERVQDWSPSKQLTRNPLGYYSDMAIDSHGVIHVIWTEADSLGWGLYYSHSSDGGATWTDRIALDQDGSVWWYRAHLKVDSSNRLHVVWEETTMDYLGRTRAAFYAQSADGGQTWNQTLLGGQPPVNPRAATAQTTPTPTAAPTVAPVAGQPAPPAQATTAPAVPAGPQQPAVGIDGQGQIVLVYRENETNLIFYQVSTGGGTRWSQPQRLPGVRAGIYRPYDIYDMVTDSAGHIHLVFVGYPAGSDALSLMHSEWDDQTWSAPQVVPSPPYPEYPKLAISTGNRLHLVWFVGDRDTVDRTPVGVYYSSSQLSTPRVSNSAVPVPMPSIVPTSVAASEPLPQAGTSSTALRKSASTDAAMAPSTSSTPFLQSPALPLVVAVVSVLILAGLAFAVTFGIAGRRR